MMGKRFRVGVDTGGTFTDLIVIEDSGRIHRRKFLSTPDDFSRGIIEALGSVLEGEGLGGEGITGFVHGTTVATNAVLQGTGPAVGLLTTQGFIDVLEIGRGRWGGDIHDLGWVKPPPLVPRDRRLPLQERVAANGDILVPLDPDEVRTRLKQLDRAGVVAVAVCLLNAYANPAHERQVKAIAAEFPHLTVCISAEILPEIREFERTSTTAINAYLMPVVSAYLDNLEHALDAARCRAPVMVMQSNGGLASANRSRLRPVDIVESGPAAGVLACCYLAEQIGEPNLIAFDMGGTTAKGSLIENGRPFVSLEYTVGGGMSHGGTAGAGHAIRVPSIDIAEVGSGGGSVAWLDTGGALRVGPRSAGAAPGPACYGLGGTEPTVTDAYAVMGYLNPSAIAGGVRPIDPALAATAIDRHIASPAGLALEEAAHGIFAVATSNMLRAVRAVTVERGRDARDYLLVAFGGAGPMHAAALASALGVQRVLVPNSPGLFSALGVLMADVQRVRSRTLLRAVSSMDADDAAAADAALAQMQAEIGEELEREGITPGRISFERSTAMQYLGQSDELIVPIPDAMVDLAAIRAVAEAFSREHERAYGYQEDAARAQFVSLRVTGRGSVPKPDYAEIGRQAGQCGETSVRRVYFGAELGWQDTRVLPRAATGDGTLQGPATLEDLDTTILIPPCCTAVRDRFGNVIISLPPPPAPAEQATEILGATALELVKNSLSSITDEMAATLARTARSLIMRDSHDFSVALCNARGELVTSGIGIAVHLGAIPTAMAGVIQRFQGRFAAGDLLITNDPYSGGMHLPDIFVFRPIFIDGELFGFAATTAHMADIGGRVPGGNAADSTEIYQEGLRIPLVKLFSGGVLNQDWIELIRANVRQPDVVIGDLLAEVAACNRAEMQVRDLCARLGTANLSGAMDGLIEYGERVSRAAIASLQPGRTSFTDYLDDDGVGGGKVRIQVGVDVSANGIVVDLTGSAPQVRSAINAPLAMARSVVAFVVKAIIGSEIPNNAGFLRLIKLVAPEGSVVNMAFPAACAARAVTAYRMVDALLGAFAPIVPDRVPAAGDGGPAVITVGGEDENGAPFVFMELISGAFGARPGADGLEGVASPIVNAQNTSCELIEATFPIRVEQYGFVPDTGGAGEHRGGLSVRRELRFLGRRAVLQIRSDRALIRPWGHSGGQPGTTSLNLLTTENGKRQTLPSKLVLEITTGAVWQHTTASGGGWGDPARRNPGAIARDVAEGKLSLACARANYAWTSPSQTEGADLAVGVAE